MQYIKEEYNVKTIEAICKLEEKAFGHNLKNIYESNNNIKYYICLDMDKVVAFASVKEDIDYCEIYNIVVDDIYRGKGIGNKLLKLFENKSCYLEVRESNKIARILYENNGFKEIGKRKRYYKEEDAIVYERKI